MKQIAMTIALTLVLGLVALAQTTPSDPQAGSQGTTPSTTSPGSPSATSPSATSPSSPSQSTSMGSQSSTAGTQGSASETKGEKKLKGCIQSQGGQYFLEEKHGKQVALTGSQDFASHVGHTVTVHGTYENASAGASTMGSSSTSSPATGTSTSSTATPSSSSGQQFMVSKIDMDSDTCKLDKDKDKDKGAMGTNPSSTNPSTAPDHK